MLITETQAQHLKTLLRATDRRLYVVLDAARSADIPALLATHDECAVSLYQEKEPAQLGDYAPYLVELDPDSPLLEAIVSQGWGESWGMFLWSARPLRAVRRHLRRFLVVKTEDGCKMYFRFYDPRVLRIFLPTCTVRQLRELFGPIDTFLVEGADPATLLRFDGIADGCELKTAWLEECGSCDIAANNSAGGAVSA